MKPYDAGKAIVIETTRGASGITEEINKKIAEMFGGINADYFIHSEATIKAKNKVTDKMHRFRVVLVEDTKEVKHQLWFDITDC